MRDRDWMVADAVASEPVSSGQFPANREKTENPQNLVCLAIFGVGSLSIFKGLLRNSLRT